MRQFRAKENTEDRELRIHIGCTEYVNRQRLGPDTLHIDEYIIKLIEQNVSPNPALIAFTIGVTLVCACREDRLTARSDASAHRPDDGK